MKKQNTPLIVFVVLISIIILGVSIFFFTKGAVFPGQEIRGAVGVRFVNGGLLNSFTEGDSIRPYTESTSLDAIDFGTDESINIWLMNKYNMNRISSSSQCIDSDSLFPSPSNYKEGMWCGTSAYNCYTDGSGRQTSCKIDRQLWQWVDDKPCFSFSGRVKEYNCDKLTPGTHYVESWYGTGCSGSGCQGNGFYASQINVAPLPCVLDSGQFVTSQIFKGGDAFSKSSLALGVVKFCSIYPTKIVDEFTLSGNIDYSVYSKLDNYQTLTVPQGQVWEVTWVTNDPRSSGCISGYNYNYNLGQCVNTGSYSGIIQLITLETQPSTNITTTESDGETITVNQTILAITTETTGQITVGFVNETTITDSSGNILSVEKTVIPTDLTITPQGQQTITVTSKKTNEPQQVTLTTLQSQLPKLTTTKAAIKIPIWVWWVVGGVVISGLISIIMFINRKNIFKKRRK